MTIPFMDLTQFFYLYWKVIPHFLHHVLSVLLAFIVVSDFWGMNLFFSFSFWAQRDKSCFTNMHDRMHELENSSL